MQHTDKSNAKIKPMQHTIKYQQHDKIPTNKKHDNTHTTHNQIPTQRDNPCNTQTNTDKTIKPMQHILKYQHDKTMQNTFKYQQNDTTHATHNQIQTKP